MTKEIEQAKIKLKAYMLRNVNLSLYSTPSAAGGSVSGQSKPKKGRVNNVDQAFNKEVRDELNCIIARMLYTGGLSFNLTRNPWYAKAFKFAAYNPITGYKPPVYNSLRTSFAT